MIVRRVRFGDESAVTAALAPAAPDGSTVDVNVRPTTVVKGVELLVTAGVLTHIVVRIVDRIFFDKR